MFKFIKILNFLFILIIFKFLYDLITQTIEYSNNNQKDLYKYPILNFILPIYRNESWKIYTTIIVIPLLWYFKPYLPFFLLVKH